MIEFYKGEGGGNDFILTEFKGSIDYSELAKRFLRRRFGVGGDGLIVYEGRQMVFYNPDGRKVAFCGNGVRVLFYLLYLMKRVEKKATIQTDSGPVELEYNGDNSVSTIMPDVEIRKNIGGKNIVVCGVPHLLIEKDNVENINIGEGKELSRTLEGGNNVDWYSIKNDIVNIRTYERGVEGETLSCASGIASVAYFLMERTGREELEIVARGGEFQVERYDDNKVKLTGETSLVFKGFIPEKEEFWIKKENTI